MFSRQVEPELQPGTPYPVSFTASLPESASVGEEITATVTMTIDEGWWIYAIDQPPGDSEVLAALLPTLVRAGGLNGLTPKDAFKPEREPKAKYYELFDTDVNIYQGQLTWTGTFEVTKAEYGLNVVTKIQSCDDGQCYQPVIATAPLGYATRIDEKKAKALLSESDITFNADEEGLGALPSYLWAAFLGGLILNIMPCVLPVLSIKVLSFVQQAGESRGRLLALNLSYAAGVLLVFLTLATLAVVAGFGWGGLFQRSEFTLVMACIIFAMALSLLGVFELPIPGFVGSGMGQQKEGLTGALLTGIVATLLATPCSGPFLGVTLAWSVQQSAAVTYLVWLTMGLGMASPYVLMGLFPALLNWLPKPGNWMVRFKEICGFVLMGTVVFFVYFLEEKFIVPLLIMLLGIGLGCWMLGNFVRSTDPKPKRFGYRFLALGLTAGIVWFGINFGKPSQHELPWQPFSEPQLLAALEENKTVLVDFTADWCLTCKMNEGTALNTEETKELVEKHNIVTIKADYTHEPEDVKKWLDKMNSRSVPLTVIFPAGDPENPILLRDVYLKPTLLEKLREAVGETDHGSPSAKTAKL